MMQDEELDEVAPARRHQPPEAQRQPVDARYVRDDRLVGTLKNKLARLSRRHDIHENDTRHNGTELWA